jgi:hypothetical protein
MTGGDVIGGAVTGGSVAGGDPPAVGPCIGGCKGVVTGVREPAAAAEPEMVDVAGWADRPGNATATAALRTPIRPKDPRATATVARRRRAMPPSRRAPSACLKFRL